MNWGTVFFMSCSLILALALGEHYFGKSLEERVIERGEQCAAQCDFQGAVSYSINLGDERDCICTFKLWRKK